MRGLGKSRGRNVVHVHQARKLSSSPVVLGEVDEHLVEEVGIFLEHIVEAWSINLPNFTIADKARVCFWLLDA
jgi:hypothetical protein